MPNIISGKVLFIGQTEQLAARNGSAFYKRQLVLDASRRVNEWSDERIENYPSIDFIGQHVNDLDNFKPGDVVTVSFVLQGRKTDNNGQVKYFTNVVGYKIEPYQRQQPQQSAQPFPSTAPTGVNPAQAAPQPSQAQPFPPPVDESGNPVNPNADDLPF